MPCTYWNPATALTRANGLRIHSGKSTTPSYISAKSVAQTAVACLICAGICGRRVAEFRVEDGNIAQDGEPLEYPAVRPLRVTDEEVVRPGLEVIGVVRVVAFEIGSDGSALRIPEDHDVVVGALCDVIRVIEVSYAIRYRTRSTSRPAIPPSGQRDRPERGEILDRRSSGSWRHVLSTQSPPGTR